MFAQLNISISLYMLNSQGFVYQMIFMGHLVGATGQKKEIKEKIKLTKYVNVCVCIQRNELII